MFSFTVVDWLRNETERADWCDGSTRSEFKLNRDLLSHLTDPKGTVLYGIIADKLSQRDTVCT